MQIAATLVKGKARINFQDNKKVTFFTVCPVVNCIHSKLFVNGLFVLATP